MPGALQGKFSDLLPDRCRVEYVCVVGLAWDFGQLRIRQDQREARSAAASLRW
jgi:hypothetical protein